MVLLCFLFAIIPMQRGPHAQKAKREVTCDAIDSRQTEKRIEYYASLCLMRRLAAEGSGQPSYNSRKTLARVSCSMLTSFKAVTHYSYSQSGFAQNVGASPVLHANFVQRRNALFLLPVWLRAKRCIHSAYRSHHSPTLPIYLRHSKMALFFHI